MLTTVTGDSTRTAMNFPPILRNLVNQSIIHPEDWDQLSFEVQSSICASPDDASLTTSLVANELLTPFQAGRISAGEMNSLILGNYRILDKIGAGGMGVVFRAEHIRLRQTVAIKVLSCSGEKSRRMLDRFFHEVQVVTKLRHPHIVVAIDAGEQPGAGPNGTSVPYLVMEYVNGRNLEDVICDDGPLSIDQACLITHQIADALTEAHRHQLVHRDIKPGNVILTEDGAAKLLDFGVARLPSPEDRLTRDGARLGTIGYMAPEQVRNAKNVDARADIFGLGTSLFFMLTGRDPFDPPAGAAGAFRPPSAREYRSEVSPELDEMLSRLMALDLNERVPTAEAAMRELMPYLGRIQTRGSKPSDTPLPVANFGEIAKVAVAEKLASPHRLLIVDDQPDVRRICKLSLASESTRCNEAANGLDAIDSLEKEAFDLVLLDVDLPGMTGEQLLRRLRTHPPSPNLKVIMLSGRASGDELSRMMLAGADDFLTKPFSVVQLRARVKVALNLKDAQDRSDLLSQHLMTLNGELERSVSSRDSELLHARGAMVLALAKIVEARSAETGAHLIRLQKYCRILASAAAKEPAYASRMDGYFVRALEDCAPLHDIGKAAVPDHVLNKPGRLDAQERLLIEAHTTAGADTLQEVARRYRFATGFLQMAVDIARHHHERWDGTGYPDKLAGEAIPLSARLLAICDVYDALRSKRVYKPSLSHNMAVMTMLESSQGHFDPGLFSIFMQIAPQFDLVFRETME